MKPGRVNRAVSPVGHAGKEQLDEWIMSTGHPQGWPVLFLPTAPLSSSVRICDTDHSLSYRNLSNHVSVDNEDCVIMTQSFIRVVP
jgi:hypothetical protein